MSHDDSRSEAPMHEPESAVAAAHLTPQVTPSDTRRGRTFPVHIDDREVLFHEQFPTGQLLLSEVGKRPCAWQIVQLFAHGARQVIERSATVDLAQPGPNKFVTEPRQIVDIFINGRPGAYSIQRGDYSVAQILALVGQTPDSYTLYEEKDGPPLPVPVGSTVPIGGCEVFHTQVQSGASS